MALIERFTPGGNIWPDGSSTFAMLGAFFQRWAENRDAMDQQIATTAAAEATDAVAPHALQHMESADAVFSVVDEDGRRLWIEAGLDGGPTTYAAEKIAPAVSGPVAASIGMEDQNEDVTGLSYSIVDEDGRRLWIEAGLDGGPTPHAIAKLREGLEGAEPAASTRYRPSYATTSFPVASGPDIVCWGDSMTAGAGANGRPYPLVLSELTGRTVWNRGVGGEKSTAIAVRAGATPLVVIPANNTIPASGAVALTVRPINGETPDLLAPSGSSYKAGTLAGVHGGIDRTAEGGLTFTRDTDGNAVTVDRPTAFLSDDAAARRGDIVIVWAGQNGPLHERVLADVHAITEHLTALDKRFLVMSKPQSTDTQDSDFHDRWGRRFIPIRRYLVEYGLADAGITPTAQDETDIAAGKVPTSLRVDDVHLNQAGYQIVAEQIANRLTELGWA